MPQKPTVSLPATVATSKLTPAPRKCSVTRKWNYEYIIIIYLFCLAVVASMTIKPTITVNGPRPTVAAVAAGNDFWNIEYF